MNSKGQRRVSRRRFLRDAAVGAAAFGALPPFISSAGMQAFGAGEEVHPNISPLRVVGLMDAGMTKGLLERSSWQQQEELVFPEKVDVNMDRLACALAEEKDPGKAWRAIFIKPAGKSWSDVVVAVKTNQIAVQRSRSAVMAKVCTVLTDVIGVKASNIFVYDACHGANMSRTTRFRGLPEGVTLADQWGGSTDSVPIPSPYGGGRAKARCLGHLARGEVDILVNVALSKGHGMTFGGFTQSMKNHFGTFEPGPAHGRGGGADYLIGINKSPQILGELDPKTGAVLFPRQQLCVIDALWASQGGPGGNATSQPNRIFMGTLPPVLDYQVATRFRKGEMKWGINEQVAERFLSEFGFTPDDLPNNGEIVDAMEYIA